MAKSKKPLLSEKEIAILQLICKEYTNPEIAKALKRNRRTIDGYRETIKKKTKAKNVVGMVVYAIQNGIFKVAIKKMGK